MFTIDFSSLSAEDLIKISNEKLSGDLETWKRNIWRFIADWFNPEIGSIQIQTSGSTGAPKQIVHTKEAMANSALATCKALKLEPAMHCLLCLPADKIGGMMMIVRSIVNNMQLHCIKPSTTPLSTLPDIFKLDFAAFTPMQFHEITRNYGAFRKAETIRKVILGGESVRGGLYVHIKRLTNEIYSTFGMTETISHIALKRLNGESPDAHYKVLPGIDIAVNSSNCMVIMAPQLNQPHLVTNDVVEIFEEGQFDWLGRADNVINSGGVKIYPEEIEQKLNPEIEPAFFIASIPDELLGNKLVLVMEIESLPENDIAELKKLLLTFDKLHRPKEVLFVKRFVRTANGKVKRKESIENCNDRIAV